MSAINRVSLVPGQGEPKSSGKISKTKGYWANGVWVKAQDAAAEKAQQPNSRSQDKQLSAALQDLGLQLGELRAPSYAKLRDAGYVSDRLDQALVEHRRISNFEAKRRLAQLIGKLMRDLPDEALQAMQQAVKAQAGGSLAEAAAVHRVETWRDELIAADSGLETLLSHLTETGRSAEIDIQHIRALVRQARKDRAGAPSAGMDAGQLPKPSRASKELFQTLKILLADD